jgi:hypothetical protein
MPFVQRGATERLQVRAARRPDEGADAHRIVGRAEARRTDILYRQPAFPGENGEAVQVRRLALVGRHAERGVAL